VARAPGCPSLSFLLYFFFSFYFLARRGTFVFWVVTLRRNTYPPIGGFPLHDPLSPSTPLFSSPTLNFAALAYDFTGDGFSFLFSTLNSPPAVSPGRPFPQNTGLSAFSQVGWSLPVVVTPSYESRVSKIAPRRGRFPHSFPPSFPASLLRFCPRGDFWSARDYQQLSSYAFPQHTQLTLCR